MDPTPRPYLGPANQMAKLAWGLHPYPSPHVCCRRNLAEALVPKPNKKARPLARQQSQRTQYVDVGANRGSPNREISTVGWVFQTPLLFSTPPKIKRLVHFFFINLFSIFVPCFLQPIFPPSGAQILRGTIPSMHPPPRKATKNAKKSILATIILARHAL